MAWHVDMTWVLLFFLFFRGAPNAGCAAINTRALAVRQAGHCAQIHPRGAPHPQQTQQGSSSTCLPRRPDHQRLRHRGTASPITGREAELIACGRPKPAGFGAALVPPGRMHLEPICDLSLARKKNETSPFINKALFACLPCCTARTCLLRSTRTSYMT